MKRLFLLLLFVPAFACINRSSVGSGFGADFNLVLSSTVSTAEVGSQNVTVKAEQKFKSGGTSDVTTLVSFSVSDSTVLDVVGGVIQAKKIGVAQITAVQGGVSSNALAITVLDTMGPSITSAVTQDLNANGLIDAIKVTFSENVKDSSMNLSAWSITSIPSKNFSSTTNGDVADDKVVYITFAENSSRHTGTTLSISFGFNPIKDLNNLVYDGTQTVNVTDGAPPIVKSSQMTGGSTYITVNFSEPVYGVSGSTTCPAAALVPGAFQYTDNNATGTSGLSTVIQACGGDFAQFNVTGTTVSGDSGDTITTVPGKIFDAAGNEVIAYSGAISVSAASGFYRQLLVTSNVNNGGHSFQIQSGPRAGHYLIVLANGTSGTNYFNPTTGTFTTGPNLMSTANAGSHSFRIGTGTNAGKWIIVHAGAAASTSLYNEADNTVAAGPALSASANTGAFAFKQSTNVWVVAHGNGGTASSLYDEAAAPATMPTGITFTGGVGDGGHAIRITAGADINKWLIIHGNNNTSTSLYTEGGGNPPAGPAFASGVGAGAHSFMATSGTLAGHWVTVRGNNTTTASVIRESPTLAINPGSPTPPALTAAVGSGGHSYKITSGTNAGKSLMFRGNNTTGTMLLDEASPATASAGPSLSRNLGNGSSSFSVTVGPYANQRVLVLGGISQSTHFFDEATNTFSDGFGVPTNVVGGGAHQFLVSSGPQSGKRLVALGNGNSTTNYFDESNLSFSAGPALGAAVHNLGSHSFKITAGVNAGKWVSLHGNAGSTLQLFDEAGPSYSVPLFSLAASCYNNCHSFQITSGTNAGKWLTIGANTTGTTLFDQTDTTAGAMVAGPSLSAVGSGTSSSFISTGTNANQWFIIQGAGTATRFYRESDNTMQVGPTLPTSPNSGALIIKITSGANAGKHLIVFGGGTNTGYFDEATPMGAITSTSNLTATQGTGGHAIKITSGVNAGKWLIIHGGGLTKTTIFDESGTFTAGPDLGGPANAGTFSFTIVSGPKTGWIVTFLGGNSVWNMYVP